MLKNLAKKHDRKLRFALVGGINTLVDFGLLFGLTWLGLPRIGANYISTSAAFILSFFANKSFTFRNKSSARRQVVPFILVTLSGIWVLQPLCMHALMLVLDQYTHANTSLFIAKVLATAITMVWNYVLYAKFVFKS